MIWANLNPDELQAVRELSAMSDRAAAIVGAVMLEDKLERLLRSCLRDMPLTGGESIQDQMFRPMGPLGSFSAKTKLGAMLGLYSKDAYKDMNCIRDIRNKFAHKVNTHSFAEVKDLCDNLVWFRKHIFESRTPNAVIPPGSSVTMYVENLREKLDTPRECYTLAVSFYFSSLFINGPSPVAHHYKPMV